ncbi:hypothetical protein H6504_04025 [Candidatus Woesearchaeota archaeon]|nr:hypothetical protein [Candidatus Woesearchaeota archaeon]
MFIYLVDEHVLSHPAGVPDEIMDYIRVQRVDKGLSSVREGHYLLPTKLAQDIYLGGLNTSAEKAAQRTLDLLLHNEVTLVEPIFQHSDALFPAYPIPGQGVFDGVISFFTFLQHYEINPRGFLWHQGEAMYAWDFERGVLITHGTVDDYLRSHLH